MGQCNFREMNILFDILRTSTTFLNIYSKMLLKYQNIRNEKRAPIIKGLKTGNVGLFLFFF